MNLALQMALLFGPSLTVIGCYVSFVTRRYAWGTALFLCGVALEGVWLVLYGRLL